MRLRLVQGRGQLEVQEVVDGHAAQLGLAGLLLLLVGLASVEDDPVHGRGQDVAHPLQVVVAGLLVEGVQHQVDARLGGQRQSDFLQLGQQLPIGPEPVVLKNAHLGVLGQHGA